MDEAGNRKGDNGIEEDLVIKGKGRRGGRGREREK